MKDTVIENAADVPEIVATPTKDACRHATSGGTLLAMIYGFLESYTGTEWQGQVESSSFETDPEWTTAKVSLVLRIPTSKVIDEFKD